MTRWTLFPFLTTFLLLGQISNGQTAEDIKKIPSIDSTAQTNTTKIQATKIKPGIVRGKYIFQTAHGYTTLKIKWTGRFSERGLLYLRYVSGQGKWKIQNDTLILTEKYREKPFGKRITGTTTKFIMQDNTLSLLSDKKTER